jgi:hypothetical protein
MTDRAQPEITPNTPLRLPDAAKIDFPLRTYLVRCSRYDEIKWVKFLISLVVEEVRCKPVSALSDPDIPVLLPRRGCGRPAQNRFV